MFLERFSIFRHFPHVFQIRIISQGIAIAETAL